MIIDCHVHICGIDEREGNYFSPGFLRNYLFSRSLKKTGIPPEWKNAPYPDQYIATAFNTLINKSQIDKSIVLALDGNYTDDGIFQKEETFITVSNSYVHQLCQNPRIMFGASVHPYRKDALFELEKWIEKGAALVKIIPSSQGIDLEHKLCLPFFDLLASKNIPLLCHTGYEHTLGTQKSYLNHPHKLKIALDRGVKVIAAHCAARALLYEKDYFHDWVVMAKGYEHCYGDLSAFVMPTRVRHLKEILRSQELQKKVFYGSDFPVRALPFSYLPALGFKKYFEIIKEENMLNIPYHCLKSMGFSEDVFSGIQKIIPLSATNRDK